MHYQRQWKYGDPIAGRTPNGEAMAWLVRAVATAEPVECILNPYGHDSGGYGSIHYDGRARRMHEVVLVLSGQEKAPKGMTTRHLCGVHACVNPHHIVVGTAKENSADSAAHGVLGTAHGEASPNARLTDDLVGQIRASPLPNRHWAELLGVSETNIQAARSGRSWKHVPGKAVPRKLGRPKNLQ